MLRALFSTKTTNVNALSGISFEVGSGEFVGYIGPNGAGKSTTLKILSGILVPDAGVCEVDGMVPWRDRIRHVRRIGVVFGQRSQLWWDLPVRDSFALLRDIYAIPGPVYEESREELTRQLELGAFLDVPVRQLSLGQRMRCDLAAALLHRPSILFLDEPTIGLDAESKKAVRAFLRQVNEERGVTILLTTHDLDDIEALATRVITIGDGRILFDGALTELRAEVVRERRLLVDVDPSWAREGRLAGADLGSQLGAIAGTVMKTEVMSSDRFCVSFDPALFPVASLIEHISKHWPIRDLYVENVPIEEVVRRLYVRTGVRCR
ncbi:MAG: ATP-binding cassette domain-containing protein [Deltaproteobacteria bacterium]|nr:ATP-binding cassette domain-containing protein [Deltaproteobacteria bacterium]